MQNEKAVIVVTAVFLSILIAAVLVFVGFYTNWYASKFSTFYLKEGKTKYFTDSEDVVLANVRFGVTYDFARNKAFTVKVLPAGEDFPFTVDDEWLLFSKLDDLTAAFDIVVSDKSFSIRCKDVTVEKVLARLFPDTEITVPAEIDKVARFKLVVATADGKHSVSITFRCYNAVKGLEFDTPNFLF